MANPRELLPFLGEGSGTKESLIRVLASEPGLSAKELHARLSSGKAVSYQAVHKLLTQLEEQRIVQRSNAKFSIDPAWISSLSAFIQNIQSTGKAPSNRQPELRVFHSVIEVGRFLIFDFFNYPNPEKKPIVCFWKRMYSVIGLSKDEVEGLRESLKSGCWVLSESDSLVDKFLADAFGKMGAQSKLGVPLSDLFDVFVVGNHVAEVYFEKAHQAAWHKTWVETTDMEKFDLEETLRIMHSPFVTKVIIEENPSRALELRKKAMAFF